LVYILILKKSFAFNFFYIRTKLPYTMSEHNIDFYQNIDLDFFKNIAVLQGFDTCYDLDIIFDIIKDSKNLVELGSGYGRILQGLLNRHFEGKITGVERSKKMIDYLQKHLSKDIELLNQDYRFFEMSQSPDVVLLIWSGILELSRLEQNKLIQDIYKKLSPDGIFVSEIPRQLKYVGVHIGKQEILVETEWGRLEAYMPTHQEMLDFREAANFKKVEVIEYTTPSDLKRAFYVYYK